MWKKGYVILLLLFIMLSLTGCTSYNYNKALNLMKKNKYDEAIEILKTMPEYKDSTKIIKNEEMYKQALACIGQDDFEQAIQILQKIKGYRDANILLEKELAYKDNYYKEKEIIDKAISIYNTRDYDNPNFANEILKLVENYDEFKTKFKEDAIIFYVYARTKQLVDNYWASGETVEDHEKYKDAHRNEYIQNLIILDPYSKGSGYNDDVIEDVLSNIEAGSENIYDVSRAEWQAAYNNKELIGAEPTIGMTKEQVIISSWGKPKEINKTTTANGVFEQWVYPDDKYIYFDNGIVTAIQE